MKHITTKYAITIDGIRTEYTETREAHDIRDAHMQIMYHWCGAEKIEFVKDEEISAKAITINCTLSALDSVEYVSHRNHKYILCEVEPEYIICVDVDNGNKLMTGWCGSLYGEESDNNAYIETYERNLYGEN